MKMTAKEKLKSTAESIYIFSLFFAVLITLGLKSIKDWWNYTILEKRKMSGYVAET